MKEIDEIREIENEALLDKAILETQKLMGEMYAMRSEIDQRLQDCQVRLGELIAHKALFGFAKRL